MKGWPFHVKATVLMVILVPTGVVLPLDSASSYFAVTPTPASPRSPATEFQTNCRAKPSDSMCRAPSDDWLLWMPSRTPFVKLLLVAHKARTLSPCHSLGAPAYAPSNSRMVEGIPRLSLHCISTLISYGFPGSLQWPSRSMPLSLLFPVL